MNAFICVYAVDCSNYHCSDIQIATKGLKPKGKQLAVNRKQMFSF